ncbi:MAG: tetratricopeptide repeat protein [Nannocystales bacterium]
MSVAAPFLAIPLSLSLVGSLVGAPPAPGGEAPADAPAGTAPPEAPKEDPKLEQAMVSYDLGKKAYNAARYEDALEHFQEAATRYASPDFQYNIGLCYERLGKREEAVRAFRTYLRAKPEAKDRANVEDRIFTLKKEIEEAENQPPPEVAPEPEPEPDPPEELPNGKGLILAGAVLTGVGGVVALGGGLGFGLAARNRSLSVEDVASGNPDDLTFAEAQTLDDEGRRFETLQIVMAATGAAVAVTGVALLAVGLKRKKRAEAGPTATLMPTWTGRSAGLSLQGRF